MGRKKSTPEPQFGQLTLVGKVNDILKSNGDVHGRPLVISSGKRNWKEIVRAKPGASMVTVRDNIIRIQENADPIGFLMEVMNGSLFPVQFVDENGEIHEHYVAAGMTERVQIAKFLANKVLPTLSVTKHVVDPAGGADESGAAYDPSRPGQPSFAQIVQMAAARRKGGVPMPVLDDDPAYHDVEVVNGEASADDGEAAAGDESS